MYNLTVDEAHTYFVGDCQWLVHNDCPIANTLAAKLNPPTKVEKGITALGNRDDTTWVAKNLPEIRTLVGVPDWSMKGNIKWLDAAMRRGDELWLVTDPKKWSAIRPKSVYFDELKYIQSKGYKNIVKWFD